MTAKRLLALLLVLVFCCMIFASCGPVVPDPDPDPDPDPNPDPDPDPEPDPDPDSKPLTEDARRDIRKMAEIFDTLLQTMAATRTGYTREDDGFFWAAMYKHLVNYGDDNDNIYIDELDRYHIPEDDVRMYAAALFDRAHFLPAIPSDNAVFVLHSLEAEYTYTGGESVPSTAVLMFMNTVRNGVYDITVDYYERGVYTATYLFRISTLQNSANMIYKYCVESVTLTTQ